MVLQVEFMHLSCCLSWNIHPTSHFFVLPSGDPYILADKCSFTLRLPGNRSHDAVALAADSADALLEQICQDLDCGGVYRVTKTSSPPSAACFRDCLHRDGRLQNCSQSENGSCTVIAEAACGKHLTVSHTKKSGLKLKDWDILFWKLFKRQHVPPQFWYVTLCWHKNTISFWQIKEVLIKIN